MDSEDSRPGSSASSSSSSSSNNSRHSSPQPDNENGEGPQSPPASPQPSMDRKSRSRSRSSEKLEGRQSRSKSRSASSGSASSSDNDDNEDAVSQSKSKRSSSEEGSIHSEQRPSSRPQSPSPVDSQRSSRHSSSSSNRSNSRVERDGPEAEVNISHEDLSDVSDMESEKRASSVNNSKQSLDDDGLDVEVEKAPITSETETNDIPAERENNGQPLTDLRHKLDKKKSYKLSENGKDASLSNGGYSSPENGNSNSIGHPINELEKNNDEDALDFEAEEGECPEEPIKEDEDEGTAKKAEPEKNDAGSKSDGEAEEGEDLEEGEVSDEDEKRPEETEPKPVCRFYTRGQCTWGMSCRFLHPGVSDKGNYTMFDLVRPIPVSHSGTPSARPAAFAADYHDYRSERPPLHHRPPAAHYAAPSLYGSHHDARALIPETPVVVESAWERGLRTAKEMMRKASKRKEQDMDFEDKKMNLPVSQEELEKDAYLFKERASPEVVPAYGRHGVYHEIPAPVYSPPDRFGRGPPIPPYEDLDPYGRSARYRELPPHRMPQYEDERRVRPTREVIVQRVEPVGRGDEWNDPWMRTKSPGARGGSREREDRRRRDRRSYSSNSSYSSSSSSQSDSSSDSSRSPSPTEHRRRYNNSSQKSPMPMRRHGMHAARSPSPPIRRGRRSPAAISDLKTEIREQRFNAFKDNNLVLSKAMRRSPMPKRRDAYSRSPSMDKRLPYSPAHKRRRVSPVTKKPHDRTRPKRRRTSSSSGSDSSDSSASDSDSDSGSSSSGSSSISRGKASRHVGRGATGKTALDKKSTRKEPPKKRSPISIEIKKQATVGASALTSPTPSASSEKESKKSRREELLKQLRAVEDAIAKKRQKLA